MNAGGASATTAPATSAAVEFPACFPATRKAAPVDRSKWRLGRKAGVIRPRRKPSYLTSEVAVPAFWRPWLPRPLDQGDLGSCTGNSPLVARLRLPFQMETLPGSWATWTTPEQFQPLAVSIYAGATTIDPFEGTYPPTDTGSDVASAMSVATAMGLFTGYRSVSSLAELQVALNRGPCVLGIDWFEGFYYPSRCGEISMTGPVMGGHAIALVGDDPDKKQMWLENSWDDYGVCLGTHCGFAAVTYGTVSELLARNGEAYCPTPPN